MGFYIRKGFNFGPLRLNLSRSGLGASFGIKGARIGIGPRGRYIHLGRGGLYYRQSLGASHPSYPAAQKINSPSPVTDGLQEIASAPAVTMSDSSGAELLTEPNRVQRRTDRFPIVLIVGGLLTLLVGLAYPGWWWLLSLGVFTGAAIYARHHDVLKGTAILRYSLEDEPGKRFVQLQTAFNQLGACQAIWHVNAASHTDDWKRNSGVNTLTKRSAIRLEVGVPPKVQCNIKVPTLKATRATLYFFPDRLLVYDPSGVGALPYSDLHAEAGQVRFVESDQVPRDATQVGTTWQYVNKKGGPDRRFSNNRQLPVMLYGELLLSSASGLRELFAMSTPAAAVTVVSALSGPGTMQAISTSG